MLEFEEEMRLINIFFILQFSDQTISAKSRENEIWRTKDTRANERPRNKDWSSPVSLPETQSFGKT